MANLLLCVLFSTHYSSGYAELILGGKTTVFKNLLVTFDSGSSYTYLNSLAYQALVHLVSCRFSQISRSCHIVMNITLITHLEMQKSRCFFFLSLGFVHMILVTFMLLGKERIIRKACKRGTRWSNTPTLLERQETVQKRSWCQEILQALSIELSRWWEN